MRSLVLRTVRGLSKASPLATVAPKPSPQVQRRSSVMHLEVEKSPCLEWAAWAQVSARRARAGPEARPPTRTHTLSRWATHLRGRHRCPGTNHSQLGSRRPCCPGSQLALPVSAPPLPWVPQPPLLSAPFRPQESDAHPASGFAAESSRASYRRAGCPLQQRVFCGAGWISGGAGGKDLREFSQWLRHPGLCQGCLRLRF